MFFMGCVQRRAFRARPLPNGRAMEDERLERRVNRGRTVTVRIAQWRCRSVSEKRVNRRIRPRPGSAEPGRPLAVDRYLVAGPIGGQDDLLGREWPCAV